MRNSLSLMILAAALSGQTAAAGPAQPQRNAGEKETGVLASTGTAPAARAGGGASLEKEALAGLKSWDARLESLRTRFTQEVDFSDAGITQKVEGVLTYLKPDRLKIEHIKPARQLVYTDKKDLWIYKPEDSQAVRTSWGAWKESQSGNFSGIMDFGNYSALAEKNSVSAAREKTPPYRVFLTLTPNGGSGLYTLTLGLSSTDYFPAEAQLSVENTIIRTRLESPEINVQLDKDLFRFVPPKGTEVLEFKDRR
ncbi:MAG TPA: outer-membrane lipoprotein carrier protein LolA [Elusimicrobiales bacterium]|nr:outer-membrane lipoprotein carrier protein LolA [Elusimicrobiales bacterium]